MPAKETKDVDAIIQDILRYERQAESPPAVSEEDGWSPFEVREFLAEEGLRTSDFHESGDQKEWWSGVASRELDEGILPAVGNYSFNGIEGIVKQLKLRGHFVEEYLREEALDEFIRLAEKLSEKALGGDTVTIYGELARREPFEISCGDTCVRMVRERFPNDKGFELTLLFER